MNPSRNASVGALCCFCAGVIGGANPPGSAAPAGAAADGADGKPTCCARQSSQYKTSLTLWLHAAHIALPQLRQYPDASVSACTAQFIESSSRSAQVTRPPAFPTAGSLHSRGSAGAVG